MALNWIHDIADLFLSNETSGALLSWSGEILFAKSNYGFEKTGFRPLTENSLKYIAAKPGDVIVANDPYLGGSYLHRYNLLLALSAPDANSPGFVLCLRREFSPRLNPAEKLDEEGLRIPPTPIFQNGQMVMPIVEAMSMHPLCPAGFKEWLQETVKELSVYFQKWQTLQKNMKLNLSPAQVQKFLTFSHQFTSEKISEKAQGEARSEVRLDTGETIKLRLEIHEGGVKADFGGTSPGFKTFLPDTATFGACYEALAEFYNLRQNCNFGNFSVLQVTKPLGCFLNAKFPSSTHRGMQSAVAGVKLAMNLALRQIVKTTQTLNTESDLRTELVFGDQRWLSYWSPKPGCEALSFEKVESEYPVEFMKFDKNVEKSYLEVEFKVLKPCQVRWHSDFSLNAPRLPAPWKKTSTSTLAMKTENGDWTALPSQGNTDLVPQSVLRFQIFGSFEKAEK